MRYGSDSVLTLGARGPVIADHDQLAPARLDAERHLEQVARGVARQDDLRELLALLEDRPVEQKGDVDAALVAGVRVGDIVVARGERERIDQQAQHVLVLDLAHAEHVRASAPIHLADDASELADLQVQHLGVPAGELARERPLQPLGP